MSGIKPGTGRTWMRLPGATWPAAPAAPSSVAGSRWRTWLPPLALVLLGLAMWEAGVRLADVPKWLLPPPSLILTTLIADWPLLAQHTWVTAGEIVAGFLVAVATGMGLTLAMFLSRAVERAIYPLVVASQTIPYIAISPLLLVWFGYDLAPKIIIITLICFFPVVVNWWDGLRDVDANLLKLSRSLGATSWQIFWKLRLPASLPFLFSGVKIAAVVSVIGAVIGEWVGSSAGLGYLTRYAASQFLTARVFAAVVLLAIMALVLFAIVSALERYFLRWQRAAQPTEARSSS